MRKGAYSLSGLVRNDMQQDVLSGDVFIFIGRRANKIKLLQWGTDGFALYEKGLERGSFERPQDKRGMLKFYDPKLVGRPELHTH